jgi:plastocyanin domain-containing protein
MTFTYSSDQDKKIFHVDDKFEIRECCQHYNLERINIDLGVDPIVLAEFQRITPISCLNHIASAISIKIANAPESEMTESKAERMNA